MGTYNAIIWKNNLRDGERAKTNGDNTTKPLKGFFKATQAIGVERSLWLPLRL